MWRSDGRLSTGNATSLRCAASWQVSPRPRGASLRLTDRADLDLEDLVEEGQAVADLVASLGDGLAVAVARPGLQAQHDERVAAGGGLQRRGELLGVRGHDAVVGVRGQDQGGRV